MSTEKSALDHLADLVRERDKDDPLFQVMWGECKHTASGWRDTMGFCAYCPECGVEWFPDPGNVQPPVGYVVRSEAEIALWLPDVVLSLPGVDEIRYHRSRDDKRMEAWGEMGSGSILGEGPTCAAALADAVTEMLQREVP